MRTIDAMKMSALLVSLTACMHVQAASLVYELTGLGDMGGELALAFAINDQGQVVGLAEESRRVPIPFLFESGQMRGLGALTPQEILCAPVAPADNPEKLALIVISCEACEYVTTTDPVPAEAFAGTSAAPENVA